VRRERSPPRFDIVHGLAPNPWREPAASSLRPHPHFRLDHVIVREIKKGRGPAVRVHDNVLLDFIEADYGRGTEFYESWSDGQHGASGVILNPSGSVRGLIAGIRGMRPGGRRKILAPPRLGGTWTGHADFGNVIYWDVVLRKIFARNCSPDGQHCRWIAP